MLVVVTCPLQKEDHLSMFIVHTWQSCCMFVQTIDTHREQLISLLLSCAVPKLLDLLHRAIRSHRLPKAVADLLALPIKLLSWESLKPLVTPATFEAKPRLYYNQLFYLHWGPLSISSHRSDHMVRDSFR